MATTPPIPSKPKAPTGELGYVSQPSATFWGGVGSDLEETPELRWPDSIKVYNRMRRSDPQVGSVLRAVTHPVRRTPWRIDPNGARDEVVEHVAASLNLPIAGAVEAPQVRTRDRFSWAQHLPLALLMLPFGHSVFEQVYRIDDATGLAHLRKLGPRLPHTITGWNVARDGGLVSIDQGQYLGAAGVGRTTIPVERLVVYTNDREGGDWWGQSAMRTAYGPWAIKARLMVVYAQSIERNGMGVPVFTGPEGGTQEHLDAGEAQAMALRAGDNSGLALPYGAKMELTGVSGQLSDPLSAIRYLDDSIAKAVLAQVLQLGSKTGSYALSSTFADIFTQSLQAIGENIRDTANAHIVEDLVDINWGADEVAPRIVFDEIGSKGEAVAVAVKELINSGAITPDAGLEAFMRTSLGLPTAEDSEQRSSADLLNLTNAVGSLVRSGYDPEEAMKLVGLDPIKHLGVLPVTVQAQDVAPSQEAPA